MGVGGYQPTAPLNLIEKMVLQSRQEIEEALKKRADLSMAKFQQDRIKFHAEPHVSAYISPAVNKFFDYVADLIPSDKYLTFRKLFKYPVRTNETTKKIFDKLSRVFDGRNPVFNYQFEDPELLDDWEYYRKNTLKEQTIWRTDGWNNFKTEINSVLIVDLPQEQSNSDKYPQPYFYWLTIDKIISYDFNRKTNVMEYIMFAQDKDKIAVIDDLHYRLFEWKDGKIGSLLVENPHDLGYCPARFFWSEPLSNSHEEVKLHPLSIPLGVLDWFLFFHTSKNHLDLYGAYPIYTGYQQECSYENGEEHCNHGWMVDSMEKYITDTFGKPKKCPVCGESRYAGPGTFGEIPITDDGKYLTDAIKIVSVDTASLDYNVKEEKRLEDEIITSVVGVDSDAVDNKAINEMQVEASYESKSNILNRLKKGFEQAQKFADETVCRLRYGKQFINAEIDYGTEFYILSASELRQRYKIAKESGASEAELDALHDMIIETEYRNNPTARDRMKTLADLEPYRHLTRQETMEYYDKGLIDEESLKIKLNFANLISRFERENINILRFGSAVSYDKKINYIINTLKNYINDQNVSN